MKKEIPDSVWKLYIKELVKVEIAEVARIAILTRARLQINDFQKSAPSPKYDRLKADLETQYALLKDRLKSDKDPLRIFKDWNAGIRKQLSGKADKEIVDKFFPDVQDLLK